MLFFSKWKITFILGALLLGLFFALPNALSPELREKLPAPFQRTLNLGLDLQGGAHMLLEVCLLYTSPSPRDRTRSRMPSSA